MSNRCVFVFQGTLPPPYSSAVPSEANGSLSSPVSTMTSQSSSSSLAKQRQSWLDLVSQASPPAGETAVVCSVQVHSHQPPHEETEEEDDSQVLESSSHQDPSETESSEESPAAEGEAQRVVSGAGNEGETLVYSFIGCCLIGLHVNMFVGTFSVCFIFCNMFRTLSPLSVVCFVRQH